MDIKKYLRPKAYTRFAQRNFIVIRDMLRMRSRLPELREFRKLSYECREEIRQYYEEYVSKISSIDMAISLELSVFLLVISNILKPRSILDIGSGFSSFIFRYYIAHANHKIAIWSIDDNFEWLETTRKFLQNYNLPDENLILWHDFTKLKHGNFDLVLHDLGNMKVRSDTLKDVIALSDPKGMIILDDIHKPQYERDAKQILDEFGLNYYNLKFYTFDKAGRYSLLVTH